MPRKPSNGSKPLDRRDLVRRSRPRALPDRKADRVRPHARRTSAVLREHPVHQHHPGRPAGQEPGRPGHRAPHPLVHALERPGDGAARQQGRPGRGRPHRLLRLRGDPLRRRLQPLLARPDRRTRRRPGVLPGPRVPGRLRPRLPGRPHQRRAAGQLPPGSGRQRPVLVPAPVADAGLLAVPDRVHGPGPDHGDLPGALHEVPGSPRLHRHRQAARSGASSATARATSRNPSARSPWPAARSWTT